MKKVNDMRMSDFGTHQDAAREAAFLEKLEQIEMLAELVAEYRLIDGLQSYGLGAGNKKLIDRKKLIQKLILLILSEV